ncbi:MAG TPA: GNAT family N-acetyltransferase [Chitinophagaceae bacterium]|nr:GNAT family N-acetyltransferase [Chitinophagaceae bacterium]
MTVVFETERLLFRLFTVEDAGLIYQLNLDPEVTRFTHDPIPSLDEARQVLENNILPQYALYNHGRWAVHLKPGLEFMGWCGLKFRAERKEVDLGYRFMKQYWGKGYATEAAWNSARYGFERLGLQRIVAWAEHGNTASLRVIEKCGMQYMGEEIIDGHPAKRYELSNPLVR